jgi:NAD(P)H-hydrate epimerase
MEDTSHRLYTAAQVRALDACAIGDHGIPGFELMQRAGKAAFDASCERFPDCRNWLVLCGGGNNGGDGYIVALLAREAGFSVSLCSLSPVEKLTGDAATAAAGWLQADGEVNTWPPENIEQYDLVIDAMLGTGLDREVGGRYRDAVEAVTSLDAPLVAIDIPSGLNADSGRVMGCATRAALTITFIGLKRGLVTGCGSDHCGELLFNDLATPDSVRSSIHDSGILVREDYLNYALPVRHLNSHKGDFGHVGVVGGIQGMSGAARLCGEAALRAGAGLVSVATDPQHADVLNLARPELMVHAVENVDDLRSALKRATVLAAGPGIGQQAWSGNLLDFCLDSALPLVVDADGLNLLAGKSPLRRNWVLTPHPAEAARLLGCDTVEVQQDRVGSAQRLAREYDAIVVLKGCGTVIAAADGRYGICPLGNPGMATAGSGDVLTGVIAALLAQGLDAWDAALCGVVAHAAAGDLAAEKIGMRGMLAGDISNFLPHIINP